MHYGDVSAADCNTSVAPTRVLSRCVVIVFVSWTVTVSSAADRNTSTAHTYTHYADV